MMSCPWWTCPDRAAPIPSPKVCGPATGKTIAPVGAVGVVGVIGVVGVVVVVSAGAPTPPLWAEAVWAPIPTAARASAAISTTPLRCVRTTGLSETALLTLSAAYGVSWRARAESGATNQLVAIRPLGSD